ncbi:MAG TPA: protein phosphatase 2C domain-containing protein [Candidatus Acidoferrales bacterium]|nr:protein phosphatase 2C domain-containing protein [Candidatus Acidoferrales bacterium]
MNDPGQARTKISAAEETSLELRIGAQTDIGRVRDQNEDRVLVFDLKRYRELSAVGTESASLRRPGVLLVVADGMGGMSGGETASQMCVENLLTLFLEKLDTPKGDGSMPHPKDTLSDAVKSTNDLIFSRATADMKLKGMGTTLTAALLEEDHMYVAQVGDSRAYLLRDSQLTKLTKDQTLLASLEEQGKLPKGGLGKAWKNMLLQAVGAQENLQVAMSETDLHSGDWLLLCSDGLHGPVPAADIEAILKENVSPSEKAKLLTQKANDNGGPDNVSVVVCEVFGSPPAGNSGEGR